MDQLTIVDWIRIVVIIGDLILIGGYIKLIRELHKKP